MTERSPWDFDPSTVSASIEVLPKDEYEFQVGEPKAYLNPGKQQPDGTTKADNFGVRYPLTVMRSANHPETVGKKVLLNGMMHTPGSQAMTKGFLMAVFGYHNKPDEEKEFNAVTATKDWKFHPPSGGVSDFWREATGLRVIGSLDTAPRQDNPAESQQQFKGWRPVVDGFKTENGR
jgi:hypothetical protein